MDNHEDFDAEDMRNQFDTAAVAGILLLSGLVALTVFLIRYFVD